MIGVERDIREDIQAATSDKRIAERSAADLQVAVEIERGEDTARYAVAAAVIAAQLQPLTVQKPAQIDLAEDLLAVERIVEQRLRSFAETRVRVGRAAEQNFIRPGLRG